MKSKTVFPNPKTPAEVGPLVANGEAELGVHIIVELVPVAGIDIVGPLPGDLQNIIVFAAAVMASAQDPEASKALVNFLRTPEASVVIKAKGEAESMVLRGKALRENPSVLELQIIERWDGITPLVVGPGATGANMMLPLGDFSTGATPVAGEAGK